MTLMILVWATALFSLMPTQVAAIEDTFTFRETNAAKRVYGPEDWNFVACLDVDTCPGWPTNWEDFNAFIPYDGSKNMCRDCSESSSGVCRRHQQSPIPLYRNVTAVKECQDRHKMSHLPGNCRWNDMKFEVLPHVLRAYQPDYCQQEPTTDYSMGYPDDWNLKFTDIVVPSHHSQDGKQYPAEIFLSHVYSKDKYNRLIGNVAVFLEEGTDDDHYPFLELYIRQFSFAARKVKFQCQERRERRKLVRSPDSKINSDTKADGGSTSASDIKQQRKLEDLLPIDFIDKSYYVGDFDPYDWLHKCGTQYYFRYNGSMPEPPCFEGVHWRVMKDPIKVSPQQIHKLEKLYLRRLNPETCERDTAGKPRKDGSHKVDLNRPQQTVQPQHRLVFCECEDFEPKLHNDKVYCSLSMEERGVTDAAWPTSAPTTAAPTSEPSSKASSECLCDPPN